MALLYTLGFLAPLLHFAEEAHAWCERHERVEHHADHGCSGHHDEGGLDGGDELRAYAPESEGEHDACGFTPTGPPKAGFSIAHAQFEVMGDGHVPSPPIHHRISARDDLLAFAPKHSPPPTLV